MENEQNLNITVSPSEKVFMIASLFLLVFTAFGVVLVVNNIKESKYIGHTEANTLLVSGEGRVFAKPDIGQVDLSVVTQGSAVAAAVTENNNKMNKITQALKEMGIKEDDLKTANYNINPNYQYSQGKSTISGYEINQTLQVKIRDLNKTSQILEKAASLGANQVGSLSFTIDDKEALKEQAKKQAVEKAKKKAEEMQKEFGIRLGRMINFNEYESGSTPDYNGAYGIGGGGGMERSVPTPQIQTGQNEIVMTVDLTYEVE
jgi:uncharacterized protein YggE